MGKGRIRLLGAIPGSRNLETVVREFCRQDGILTSLSDPAVRLLAGMIPEGSQAEAIPFGSLVRRMATLCDEYPLPISQDAHVFAAVGAACETLSIDSPFYKTRNRLGLHRAIAETLHEMSEHGLTADDYESMAERADEALASKLDSLAAIERTAADTLKDLGRTFARELHRVCQSAKLAAGARLNPILVLAAGDYNPLAFETLRWAAEQGADITVIVYRHSQSSDFFHGAKKTAAALGLEPEPIGTSNGLLEHLFSPSAASSPSLQCCIVSTADPLAEAEWALRGCLERNRLGVPYERMALYVRDSASYAPLIEASAKRLGVPVRMWRRAPLLTNSFARLALSALEVCSSSDVRSILTLARTTYVKLAFAQRTELAEGLREAYCQRSKQWAFLREWVGARKESYPWLVALLDWRDEAVASPAALEGWIARIRDLMIALPVDAAGAREADKRAQYVLQQSLNVIASVRRLAGPRTIGLGEFATFAREVWSDADVSVPSGDAGVLVCAQSESLPDVRCLFVLGMLEGVFPRRRTETPILSDFDREAMSSLVGKPLPTSRDRAEAERDEFYVVCAAASEEIVFSYPETDEERDNVPAFYLDEVERAIGHVTKITRPRRDIAPPLEECVSLSDREIRSAIDSPDRDGSLPLAFQDPETSLAFEQRPDLGHSPRELREALQCPFSHFVRRRLDVKPERLRARWFSLIGLPKSGALHGQDSAETVREALDTELDRQLDEMYSEVPGWEISLLRSGGRRLIREWVDREFTARRIWPRDDVKGPVRFGEEGLRDVLPKIAKLSGGVVATSRIGGYPVAHLVETSGPAKVYGMTNELVDQDKLYYGLHLLAIWDAGAGALEVETMAGERLLMVLPRLPGAAIQARVQEGLKVVDLGGGEDSGGPRRFFKDVKDLAHEAVARIENLDVRAIRGDHCMWCDYGELCRNSLEFGEEDSPFVEDL